MSGPDPDSIHRDSEFCTFKNKMYPFYTGSYNKFTGVERTRYSRLNAYKMMNKSTYFIFIFNRKFVVLANIKKNCLLATFLIGGSKTYYREKLLMTNIIGPIEISIGHETIHG